MSESLNVPELAVPPQPPARLPLPGRIAALAAVFLPLAGLVAAIILLWGWGFTWVDFGLLVGMYVLTALGITVGFHRLFVHRSFDTYMWVKTVLAVLGSMAVVGGLLNWVAQHRRHHQHSDTPEDPHTPHHKGSGVLGVLRGLWFAHIGWFFAADPPGLDKYVKDLSASRTLRVIDKLFPLWILLGLILPGVIGGILGGSWVAAWRGLLWGGLVRVFLVHHVTWSVNSIGHLWGMRPYRSDDESRDNYLLGLLSMGEGWHNTHHAFPTSARHGLRWWQPDISYYVIRSLRLFGLAWNVKLPTKQMQAQERRT